MSKCRECGQEKPEKTGPVIDQYGREIKIDGVILVTKYRNVIGTPGCEVRLKEPIENGFDIVMIDRIEWDLFSRVYELSGRSLGSYNEFILEGTVFEPAKGVIAINSPFTEFI